MTWALALMYWQQALQSLEARGSAAPTRNAFTSPGSNLADLGRVVAEHAFWCFIPFIAIALLMLLYVIIRFRDRGDGRQPAHFHENNPLEFLWTIVPLCVVIYVGLYSFPPLHFMEFGGNDPALNVNVIGHQWFWEYKYPAYNIDISSQTLVLPANQVVDLDLTSVDVIHGFFVPGLGVQEDALPGRITNLWFKARPGYYKGQCDQLCGVNHSDMLIDVAVVSPAQFQKWIQSQKNKPMSVEPNAKKSARLAPPVSGVHTEALLTPIAPARLPVAGVVRKGEQ